MASIVSEIQSRIESLDRYTLRSKHHGYYYHSRIAAQFESLKQSFREQNFEPKGKGLWPRISAFASRAPAESKLDEINNELIKLQESLPDLDILNENLLTCVSYKPLSPMTGAILARTRREPISDVDSRAFAAEASDGRLLVFKEIGKTPFSHMSAAEQEQRSSEERKWSSLQHENILLILGTADFQARSYLVSEFAANGNIVDYLTTNPSAAVLGLICDTAAAIEYLHVERGLVHGDIKPTNILVSWEGRALLCDFSTVKRNGDDSSANSKGKKSVPYLSPECLVDGTFKRTTETDMWAFGITMSQIIKRAPSAWDIEPEINRHGVFRSKVVVNDERPNPPQFTYPIESHAWDVASLCWNRDASQRLTISEALKALRRLAEKAS